MTRRIEAEIDQRLAATAAAEYVEEEQAAAEEEAAEGGSWARGMSLPALLVQCTIGWWRLFGSPGQPVSTG